MKKFIFFILIINSIVVAQNKIFDFTIDKRLFISYAFMNAAGNNEEWRKEGMDSIRIGVQNSMKAIIDSAFLRKIHDYVDSTGLSGWEHYGGFAVSHSGPPSFELIPDPQRDPADSNYYKEVDGLKKYFVEFYKNYDIESIWNKYKSAIQNENNKYEPYANKAIKRITDYCRMSSGFFSQKAKKIFFQRIPLIPYSSGAKVVINDDIYIINGPTVGEPSEWTFSYEALHHQVGEIIKKHSALVEKYSFINSLNTAEIGYDTWTSLFEECLVSAIEKILSAKISIYASKELEGNINDDYKFGLILCPYFNEELRKYEQSNLTLDEYFPKLLSNLDFNREKERLDSFNKVKR